MRSKMTRHLLNWSTAAVLAVSVAACSDTHRSITPISVESTPAVTPTVTTTVTESASPAPTVTVTETVTAEPEAPRGAGPAAGGGGPTGSTIPEGTWTVGVDVKAGTYRAVGAGSNCYWGIYKSGTNQSDIIDNHIGGGNLTVTLKAGQDFETVRCGTWSKT